MSRVIFDSDDEEALEIPLDDGPISTDAKYHEGESAAIQACQVLSSDDTFSKPPMISMEHFPEETQSVIIQQHTPDSRANNERVGTPRRSQSKCKSVFSNTTVNSKGRAVELRDVPSSTSDSLGRTPTADDSNTVRDTRGTNDSSKMMEQPLSASQDSCITVYPASPIKNAPSPMVILKQQKRTAREVHESQLIRPAAAKRRKRGCEDNNESEDELTKSDEIVIGLPKEQYKPRPSRSRAGGVTSILQPEGAFLGHRIEAEQSETMKGSLNRRSSGAEIEQCSTLYGRGVVQLMEMGFTACQSRKALAQADGNINRAMDTLLSSPTVTVEGNNHQETAHDDSSGKLEQDYQDKQADAAPESETAETNGASTKKRGRPKKRIIASMKTSTATSAEDLLGDRVDGDDLKPPLRESNIDRKRRGRPKKLPIPELRTNPAQAVQTADDQSKAGEASVMKDEQETNLQASLTVICREQKENVPPQVDPKQEMDTGKAGLKQSAAQALSSPRGRVPLRVGLSRRSAIPSLLRSAKRP